jgi:HK97 family phage major capsid protein
MHPRQHRGLIGYTRSGRPVYEIAGGGPTVVELRQEMDELVRSTNEVIERLNGAMPEGEDADKLRTSNERYLELESEIKKGEEFSATTERFRSAAAEIDSRSGGTQGAGADLYRSGQPTGDGRFITGSPTDEPFTPGEFFTRSAQYQEFMKKYPGGPPENEVARSDAVAFPGMSQLLGLRTATDRLRAGQALTGSRYRALVTSSDSSAGELVRPDYRGLLEPGRVRPVTVRDLVTTIPVSTDAIEYIREASRISNAAPTAEASQLAHTGDEIATKPEGGIAFEMVADVVRTIAEWVPVTRRILSDAPALRAYIDQYLTDDLAIELEDQIVAGPGTGQNFTGILNTPGIQTAGPPVAPANMIDALRTARRLIVVNARTFPTAVLVNPVDAETIDILKFVQGTDPVGYVGRGPYETGAVFNPTLWGMPVVETEAVPAGTALVGDFRRAVLFDREAINIVVGTAGDDFIRNIVRVLAEMRAGFGVLRPLAFVAVDLA